MWINSKALELAGITARPAENAIEDAGIVRDPDGSPTGVIRELSMEIVQRAVLAALSTEEKLAMLRKGIRALNQLGITTAVNATGDLSQIELYATLRDRGELTIRTRNSFGTLAMPQRLTPQFLSDLELARKRYDDDWVSANLVKLFTDGASGPWPPIYKSRSSGSGDRARSPRLSARDARAAGQLGAHGARCLRRAECAQWKARPAPCVSSTRTGSNLAISSAWRSSASSHRCSRVSVATPEIAGAAVAGRSLANASRRRSERGIQQRLALYLAGGSVYRHSAGRHALGLGRPRIWWRAVWPGPYRRGQRASRSGSRRARPSMPTRERERMPPSWKTRWALSKWASSPISSCSPGTLFTVPVGGDQQDPSNDDDGGRQDRLRCRSLGPGHDRCVQNWKGCARAAPRWELSDFMERTKRSANAEVRRSQIPSFSPRAVSVSCARFGVSMTARPSWIPSSHRRSQ